MFFKDVTVYHIDNTNTNDYWTWRQSYD
jgi:hypothetical protein